LRSRRSRNTNGSSPDYFDKVRPVISNAPATINLCGNFTINTPTPLDIAEVVLLRPGAVTHGFNLSQRGIELVNRGHRRRHSERANSAVGESHAAGMATVIHPRLRPRPV
jgi:hypothetical protein